MEDSPPGTVPVPGGESSIITSLTSSKRPGQMGQTRGGYRRGSEVKVSIQRHDTVRATGRQVVLQYREGRSKLRELPYGCAYLRHSDQSFSTLQGLVYAHRDRNRWWRVPRHQVCHDHRIAQKHE